MLRFLQNPARRLVVAIIPTDHFAGRGELRGVSAVAASRGWSLETIDTALFRTMRPRRQQRFRAERRRRYGQNLYLY